MSRLTKGRALRELALGLRAKKTLANLADANIFTIYGRVLVTLLWGQSTGLSDAGVTTIKLQEETNSVDLCAATTITDDAIGTIYTLTGDFAVVMNGTGNAPSIGATDFLSAFPHNAFLIGMKDAADAIQLVQTGDDATGIIEWHILYIPLDDDAYVVAA